MAKFETLNRGDTLAQRAYASLRRAIRDGELVQDNVYSEAELANLMGISRTPVREALIELSRQGLVEILPQRGFRLRSLAPEEQSEVFALRLALEGYVVRRLAKEATPDQVDALRTMIERQRKSIGDPSEFLAIDEEFHLRMPSLLGLARTEQMLLTLRGAMWLMGSLALTVRERAPHVLAEHEAIIDAIEQGDARRAQRALAEHLDTTLRAAQEIEAEARPPATG